MVDSTADSTLTHINAEYLEHKEQQTLVKLKPKEFVQLWAKPSTDA
jgi:hypothetical protein